MSKNNNETQCCVDLGIVKSGGTAASKATMFSSALEALGLGGDDVEEPLSPAMKDDFTRLKEDQKARREAAAAVEAPLAVVEAPLAVSTAEATLPYLRPCCCCY